MSILTTTITTGNFKGGVGKTTNAVMIAYTLSNRGKKSLIVDLDPQANATDLLFTTMSQVYGIKPDFSETLEVALKKGSLENAIVHVNDNLDLLPSDDDLQNYDKFLSSSFPDDYTQDHYFSKLLSKISSKYDFVILDVPPQLNKFTDSALVASDYVIVILQTQERSLRGAETYVKHLLQIKDDYSLDIDLLGVLPVLQQNGNDLDLDVIEDATTSFGNANMFKQKVRQMARLKRFDRTGITNNASHDINDRRVHHLYDLVVDELLERLKLIRG